MTYDDLNCFIFNYIKYNKTNSAIMLNGGWGTGKSYYINNTLKPFLKEHNVDCIVISLYGLKELSEISKAIYIESKFKSLQAKTERIKSKFKNSNEGIFVAKTVFKGIFSYSGIDFTLSDSSMKKLYESIDLSNKLIILEDFERTDISTAELLGYVNSLVDQDNAKVLIVANEQELAKQVEIEDKNINNKYTFVKNKKYTEEAKAYIKIKEKTISDTIQFIPSEKEILYSIIDSFESVSLNKYKTEQMVEKINYIFDVVHANLDFSVVYVNYRTLIYAFQKYIDITKDIDFTVYQPKFEEKVLYSIIAFSERIKGLDEEIKWIGNDVYSAKLGLNDAPLYKFCYEYIINQNLNVESVDDCYKEYLNFNNHAHIVSVFNNYSDYYETEIKDAFEELVIKLQKNEISYGVYYDILYYLVLLENQLGIDIDFAVDQMIKNARCKKDRIGNAPVIAYQYHFDDETMKQRYTNLVNSLVESSNKLYNIFMLLTYDYKNFDSEIRLLFSYAREDDAEELLSKVDIDEFANLYFSCSPRDMKLVRELLQAFYNKKPKINDIESIKAFYEKIQGYEGMDIDSIQKLNTKYFVLDLEKYLGMVNE